MTDPAPSNPARIINALTGAWRLANFDREGFKRFDISAEGFWHSFLAAVVGAPLFAIHVVLERRAAEQMLVAAGENPTFGPFYINAAADYILLWPVFAVAMILLTRLAGRGESYAGLVIAYNWSRIIAMLIRLPVMLLVAWGLFGSTAMAAALVLTYGLILVYQWYVARVALGSGFVAVAVVLADMVLGLLVASLVATVVGDPVLLGQGADTVP